MKTAKVSATVLLIVCMTVMAGCSGFAGDQQAGERTNQSWSGSWMTKVKGGDAETPMDLVQSGVMVFGTYGYGDGTISAVVQDNRLSGTWHEDGGRSAGRLEFVLSDNGLSFTGWYAYPEENFDDVRLGQPRWRGWRI
ncbi:MAG: hypothetical protein A4E35_01003 [Methanoregula sp. PtaU1.Bin051]|nr:MAG: hypothetical protein A4E35_01003 [Methanoregula sp. PtaU1.Bin051]